MNDYSDLLYTIMSIVIFSFLLLQANSLILRNEAVTVDHEYEKTAIAVAQSIIDEAKTKLFDQNMTPNNIPQGFTGPGQLGNRNGRPTRDMFTVFDDYHRLENVEDEDVISTPLGDYRIEVTVTYFDYGFGGAPEFEDADDDAGKSTSKRMRVTATSVANNESATLEYIKSFFTQ